MRVLAGVIAGCAPGTRDCADHADLPGIDTWFVVLVLALAVLLVLAVVAGATLLLRRALRRRWAVASRDEAPTVRA